MTPARTSTTMRSWPSALPWSGPRCTPGQLRIFNVAPAPAPAQHGCPSWTLPAPTQLRQDRAICTTQALSPSPTGRSSMRAAVGASPYTAIPHVHSAIGGARHPPREATGKEGGNGGAVLAPSSRGCRRSPMRTSGSSHGSAVVRSRRRRRTLAAFGGRTQRPSG